MTTNVLPLEIFDCEGDNASLSLRWAKWKRAFQIYITAANIITPQMKRATLLHSGGVGLQDIFYSIPGIEGSGNAEEDIYEVAMAKLDEYFTKKGNIIYERHLFRLLKQEEGESFDKYLIRLRTQVEKCNYTNKDEELMDQIIEKCRMKELRKKIFLLHNEDITLKKIIDEALTLELINHLHFSKTKKKQTSKIDTLQRKKKGCIRCGSVSHKSNDIKCPSRNIKCLKCGNIGHYKEFCLTKINRYVQFTNKNNKTSKTNKLYNKHFM